MDRKYLTFTSLSSASKSMIFINFFDHIYMCFQDKQLKSDSAKHIDAEILAKHKKKEREAAKQGKCPFYLNKCNPSYFHTLSFYAETFAYVKLVLSVLCYTRLVENL